MSTSTVGGATSAVLRAFNHPTSSHSRLSALGRTPRARAIVMRGIGAIAVEATLEEVVGLARSLEDAVDDW